jgi:hypothetical protein
MDILSLLVKQASKEGQLQPLSTKQLKHRISLYVVDEVIFLRPYPADITLVLDMLQLFWQTLGLQTNVQKSSVLSIRCDEHSIHY